MLETLNKKADLAIAEMEAELARFLAELDTASTRIDYKVDLTLAHGGIILVEVAS